MATTRDEFQIKVSNYLVPATGGTAAVRVKYAGDGTEEAPKTVEWKTYSLDGEPFNPSGFYAANFSLESVFIKISMNDLIYEIPAGAQMGRMYPAPFDHSVSIYGTGEAEIVFVNSPVIPYGLDGGGSGGGAVTVADGADVALGVTTAPFAQDFLETVSAIAVLKGILGSLQQVDSNGDPLPLFFESLPWSATYAGGIIQTETRTDVTIGTSWTRQYTYTGADLTGISAWEVAGP